MKKYREDDEGIRVGEKDELIREENKKGMGKATLTLLIEKEKDSLQWKRGKNQVTPQTRD